MKNNKPTTSDSLVLDKQALKLADKDPTTRRVLEGILAQDVEHANELKDWLDL